MAGGAHHAGGADRWAFLTRPGAWFWTLVALGLAGRVLLATATAGSPDVRIWQMHARAVSERGLIAHYAFEHSFNHPPPIGWAMSAMERLSRRLGIAFRILYRLAFALADLASAFLILRVLRGGRWRYVACAAYCVSPVALVLAAEHGNTDALVATCLLVATLLVAGRRPIAAGLVIGIMAGIKIPGLLAAPALGFALARWRDRLVCALVALGVAAAPYAIVLPAAQRFALDHPDAQLGGGTFVARQIFLYRGSQVSAVPDSEIWLWGLKSFGAPVFGPHFRQWPRLAQWWVHRSYVVALPLMFLFGFLRRRENSAPAIGLTIAATYAIFYALIETWSTHYLAWSAPFWMLAGWPFAVASNLVVGGYDYGFHAFRSGDWLLRPAWGRPVTAADWPTSLAVLRDLSLLVFLAFGACWLTRAARDELRAWRDAPPPGLPGP